MNDVTHPVDPMTNGPYLSVCQTHRWEGAFDAASYLRLGSYSALEANASDQSNLQTSSSTTALALSRNDGVLIYTDQNLQKHVLGNGRMKYGTGHNVEITNYDLNYKVSDGHYELYAAGGIAITVGGTESSGQSGTVGINIPSNVQLSATGYIIQNVKGNHEKKIFGERTEITKDLATKIHLVHRSSLNIGLNTSITVGLQTMVSFGYDLSINAGPFVLIYVSGHTHFSKTEGGNYRFGDANNIYVGIYNTKVMKERSETVGANYGIGVVGTMTVDATTNLTMNSINLRKEAGLSMVIETPLYTTVARTDHTVAGANCNYKVDSEFIWERALDKSARFDNFYQKTEQSYWKMDGLGMEMGDNYYIINNQVILFR